MKRVFIIGVLVIGLFIVAALPNIGTGKIIETTGKTATLQTTTGVYQIQGNYKQDQTILFYVNDTYYTEIYFGV